MIYGLDLFNPSGGGIGNLSSTSEIYTAYKPNGLNIVFRSRDVPSTGAHDLYYSRYPYIRVHNLGILDPNTVMAYSNGAFDNLKHPDFFRLYVKDKPTKLYFFKPSTGTFPNTEQYGIELYDEKGKILFHSNMQTLKIIGVFSKLKNKPFWFKDINNVKEIAFIPLGADYSRYTQGYWDTHSVSIMDSSGNKPIIYPNVDVFDYEEEYEMRTLREAFYKSEVLFYIIDVTNYPHITHTFHK